MITGVHTLIYTDDEVATRRFFTDVLGLPSVDAGGGWLIYTTGPSELGIHPTRSEHGGQVYETPRQHQITFMCDDIEATVAELSGRGATFVRDVRNDGWGLTTEVEVPGADPVMIYQPRHATAAY